MDPAEPGADSTQRPSRSASLVHLADQATVALLVAAALVSMAVYWLAHGGCGGELIEIERAAPQRATFQVDLNRADWPELAQLPGVGETLARRIIMRRDREGRFNDPGELLRVEGIGPAKLEQIKPYLAPLGGADRAAPDNLAGEAD